MKIADILQKENNNVNLLRLIFAYSVILNHTIIINGFSTTWHDQILAITKLNDFGRLAVKFFFFFSGLFVTSSLLQKKSVRTFVVSRSLRIFPAFFVVLVCSAIFIGPWFSRLSLHDYFTNLKVYSYIFDNITFRVNHSLPGVFQTNLYKGAVNGSLWTLPYELQYYAALLAVFLLCQSKTIRNLICFAVILDTFLPQRVLLQGLISSPDISYPALCFAFGALLAINADKVEITGKTVIGGLLLAWLTRNTDRGMIIFVLASSLAILFLSANKYLLKIKLRYDISYGVYLWGFVVQQSVYSTFGHLSAVLHFLLAATIATMFALLMYFLIEKPVIRMGKDWQRFTKKRNASGLLAISGSSHERMQCTIRKGVRRYLSCCLAILGTVQQKMFDL